ncbi:MAG: ABC transporter substrate-binding protein [Butyrivibrio sp.]
MKKFKLSYIGIFLALIMIFTGCKSNSSPGEPDDNISYSTFISVDVYDSLANYEGIQSGWFAKLIKEKFNMELNIIAPNVSSNASSLYETRFAAGNIGDLIICSGESGKLQDLVDAGLVIDMTRYLERSNLYQKYHTAVDALNDTVSQDGIYAIPGEISTMSPDTSCEVLAPSFGTYLRWDYYAELGYPEISTLEDLLPVIKEMQERHPTSESGKPVYGFSFFGDWDRTLMTTIKQPCCFYGYDEYGFVLAKADGTDFQSVLDEDSLYMRSLRFYFTANRMGLVDPESKTQSYYDVFSKTADGQVLFGAWPWLAQSAFNTTEHLASGKAFMFVPIGNEKIYSTGSKNTGNMNKIIAIGSRAEDPARLAAFIDWMYSSEGIRICGAQANQGTCGPEGLTWEMTEDGPALTELGIEALINGNCKLPEEWGGGMWADGTCALNFSPVTQNELDENGYPYYFSQWDSVLSLAQSEIEQNWSEYMVASTVMEYLNEHDEILVSPGTDYVAYKETTELSTIRSQCSGLVVQYSWAMVFAKDEAEFESLYEELILKAEALGYKDILEYDMENAMAEGEIKKEILSK